MSIFSPPIAHGTLLTRMTPSAAAPDLRFKGDPLVWISVPAGTAVTAFATGAVARAQRASDGIPGNPAASWTLFQLSPFPQMNTAAFKAIPGGLPVQLVLVGAAGAAPSNDDCLVSGAAMVTAPAGGAFLAFAFQDRLCRDPLTCAEAIAKSGACDPSWAQFVADLAALAGARNVRILDHRGAPMTSGTVSVSIDGRPPTSVALTGAMDGDTGVNVGAASRATVAYTSAAHPIVASGDDDTGQLEGAGLDLAPGARLAQVLDADAWLATPELGVQVSRWNADSFVEPIQEGTPYFTRLVADLGAAKPGGKVELAGWAFVRGSQSDSKVDWPLVPGQPSTTLLNLINDLRAGGVEVRMLVNKFLRFDAATLDDFPELAPILFSVYASLSPLQALLKIQTDPAGYVVGLLALAALETVLASPVTLDAIKSFAEFSQPLMDALAAIDPSIATWTPYDAAFSDNSVLAAPFTVLGHTLDDISHLGVYHQKYVNIKKPAGDFVSYLGGIEINNDRPDTTIHRALHPFHDIQVRVTGPAVADVVRSWEERANKHGATVAIPTAGLGAIPAAGSHLVQIARTYFKPGPTSPTTALPFAPNGESTPVRSMKSAIGQARDFIYIEDQYFTPPDDYVQALIAAAGSSARALFITVPYQTDQPYGGSRRADVFNALRAVWGARLFIGCPLRRFLHEIPALTTNLGRMRLANPLTAGAAQCDLSPPSHVPPPPFWAFIGNELALAHAPVGGPSGTGSTAFQTMEIARAVPGTWGATPVAHPAGVPVLAVQVPPIYVHAKMMIVDDILLFVGSSNLNRRSLYHDGEINSFTVPQHLRGDPTNPARLLRSRLMAEHMGLQPEMGQSLFADPFAAIDYFTSRSWYRGAHRQSLGFFGSLPPAVSLGTSDTIGGWLLGTLIGALRETAKPDLWPLLVDPTTSLDASMAKGPGYP